MRVPEALTDVRLSGRDLTLAAGLALLGELELFSGERYNGAPVWPGPRALVAVLILALLAPLAVRRSRPRVAVIGVFALLTLYSVTFGAPESATGFVVLIVTTFSAAAYVEEVWLVLLAAGAYSSAFFFTDPSAEGITDKTWVFGLAGVAFLLGRAVHTRQARIHRLQEEASLASARHTVELEQAVSAERAVMARELHDIVSHAVSVIVIQAQAGTRALPAAPEVTAEALAAIEESARTAMDELRRLLMLLGPDVDAAEARPVASLAHLEDLIHTWRLAGVSVEALVAELPPLPPAVELAAFRVVQEALTNTARHAPGASATVTLDIREGHLEVVARDDGAAHAAVVKQHGSGRGLVGLRERVELVGGQLVAAGPTAQGFLVHSRIPVPVGSA